MNRIDKKFKELKENKQKAFIAYITAFDPDGQTTKKLVLEFGKAGVDIIELGIPFSDPIADGPTIQKASYRSLSKNKTNLTKVFKLVNDLRRSTDMPIIFMTYYNLIFRYGLSRFVSDADRYGVDGVIVPDLPPEEADDLIRYRRLSNLKTIFLTAPTSTQGRIRLVKKVCNGFVYYVSLTGVTGARAKLPSQIKNDVKRIRGIINNLPICVGFGISNNSQAKAISKYSDGVIVGSAIVRQIEKNLGKNGLVKNVSGFVSGLVKAVKAGQIAV